MADFEAFKKECVEAAKKLPYGLGYDGECEAQDFAEMGIGPVGRHRDSDALEESNFEVISEDLRKRFPGKVAVLGFNHWGVGWVEEIGWDASDPEIVKAVHEWAGALENYPVASDDHFYELEWDRNHPSENECYAEDREDCSCGLAERERKSREEEEENDAEV